MRRLPSSKLSRAARAHAGRGIDEEILEWCFEKGRQLNDDDRLIWSHFISKFGWSDFATARLEELKQKHGVSDRKDIMTIANAIDLDEKRKS